MISAKNLSYQMQGEFILRDINFSLEKGEVLVALGPSGGGKTTLLRTLSGICKMSSGTITIDKHKFNPSNAHLLSKKVGMVFQNYNLFPHMSVLENLTYAPMAVKGIPKATVNEIASEMLAKFSLAGKEHEMPSKLSGGQKQRVAIARALMMHPDVILFDEPTSALDPEIIRDIIAVISELKAHQITTIITTHQMNMVKKLADHVLFIDKGEAVEYAPVGEFISYPKSHKARLFLQNMS